MDCTAAGPGFLELVAASVVADGLALLTLGLAVYLVIRNAPAIRKLMGDDGQR